MKFTKERNYDNEVQFVWKGSYDSRIAAKYFSYKIHLYRTLKSKIQWTGQQYASFNYSYNNKCSTWLPEHYMTQLMRFTRTVAAECSMLEWFSETSLQIKSLISSELKGMNGTQVISNSYTTRSRRPWDLTNLVDLSAFNKNTQQESFSQPFSWIEWRCTILHK